MSRHRSRGSSSRRYEEEDSIIPTTRQLEAFGRKVTATASQLLGPVEGGVTQHYQNALGEINRELRHPSLQRKIFSLAQASPKEIIRSRNITEIQQRALAFVPDELLQDIPADNNSYSLFQGFQATLPEAEEKDRSKKQSARNSRGQRLLEESAVVEDEAAGSPITKLRNEKERMTRRLEMMGVRKNMCSTEIHEIDHKIANLNSMRKIVLDRLAGLEQEEMLLEHEISEAEIKIEELQEQLDDDAALAAQVTPTMSPPVEIDAPAPDSPAMDASFMSESIYQKLPSPKAPKRPKAQRRRTTHILHEHLQAGSKIRELQAHNDIISTLDFDVPFGTMVTAALDDTVRVWDLNAGRCIGLLEGHLSSVRCLQVEDNIVATGSMDASVRLWDLSQADYTPHIDSRINKLDTDFSDDDDNDAAAATSAADLASTRATQAASMRDCPMFTLSAHVAEITALHFHNNTLISGSADKTLRQWDLAKGRCVQTLDVLWAAAQASSTISPATAASSTPAGSSLLPDLSASWRPTGTGRVTDASADFVGALQCFDAALACGTADGLVRLWDLRSGQVHRSLVGHTGAVTCLQFDDVHLVTGSLDRSIRIWDLRTGSIFDAFAYDQPVTSMMFDARRIVAAASEPFVKVYDKTDGSHWDCGAPTTGGEGAAAAASLVGERASDAPAALGATVERVRIKDGYMIEGRRDGVVGVWSC